MEAGDKIQLSKINCHPIRAIRLLYHADRRTVLREGTSNYALLHECFYFLFKEDFKVKWHGIDPRLCSICCSERDVMFEGTCRA